MGSRGYLGVGPGGQHLVVGTWGTFGSGVLGVSGSGTLGSSGSGLHTTIHVLLLWAPFCLQRWNQRLVTLEDGKLLISKDGLVSCVLNGNL